MSPKPIAWRLTPYDAPPDFKAVTVYFTGEVGEAVKHLEAASDAIPMLKRIVDIANGSKGNLGHALRDAKILLTNVGVE